MGPLVLVVLLVDAVIAVAAAGTPSFPTAPWSLGCGCRSAGPSTTTMSARALRAAAETWRAERAEDECPTPERLLADRAIDSASKTTDAWDHPYFIRCEADETTVSSWGPNGKDDGGEGDDIVVPPRAGATWVAASGDGFSAKGSRATLRGPSRTSAGEGNWETRAPLRARTPTAVRRRRSG
jgi:hypothetical protein